MIKKKLSGAHDKNNYLKILKSDLIESIVQDAVSVRSASLESKKRQKPILIEDIEELEEQMRISITNS